MINDPKISIRKWLVFFMVMLFLSGLTAIPVEAELSFVVAHFPFEGSIKYYLQGVLTGIQQTSKEHPYLFYGYDWLAFAHFMLALLFIGPYRDPVRNKWVIQFGIIACVLIIPFAFIAGHFRGIPVWWRLIDCSFGVIGTFPLWISLRKIYELEKEEQYNVQSFQTSYRGRQTTTHYELTEL